MLGAGAPSPPVPSPHPTPCTVPVSRQARGSTQCWVPHGAAHLEAAAAVGRQLGTQGLQGEAGIGARVGQGRGQRSTVTFCSAVPLSRWTHTSVRFTL